MRARIFIVLIAFFTFLNFSPGLAWEFYSEVDDFGSTRVFVTNYFVSGIGNTDSYDEAYDYGDYFSLVVRCQDKKVEVYLNTPTIVENSSTALVKFGNSSPKTWPVSRSSDRESIFFGKSSTLVASMIKANKFYVRASGSEGYLMANFNTSGLSSYRNQFKKGGCKI